MHPAASFERRQQLVRNTLARRRVAALLVLHLPNVRYLCGFTGSAAALVVHAQGSAFFTDGRYIQQARQEVTASELFTEGPPLPAALAWIAKHQSGTLGFEGTHITVADFSLVRHSLGRRTQYKDASGLVEEFRMVKDDGELGRLRAAVDLGGRLFEHIAPKIRPGIAEAKLAAELEYQARLWGAEGMSFESIVAGGIRSALPHGRASQQPLPRRGFVVLDFGVILSGYCSDMTRTVHLGRPDARARRLYGAVLKAQLAAIDAVRPGQAVGRVDAAARKVLAAAGLGRYFTHSTGHGVGLEIHEPPRIAKAQRLKLQPGMVITIEPGVYIPGEGGIRIEDMVLVTDRGCEVLTPTAKELTVV
jgi:Xaa-Pro aminopeptidase